MKTIRTKTPKPGDVPKLTKGLQGPGENTDSVCYCHVIYDEIRMLSDFRVSSLALQQAGEVIRTL